MFQDASDLSGKLFPEYVTETSPDGKYTKTHHIIGTGGFKKVYKGMNLLTGREVAWSTVNLQNLSDYQSDALLREVKIQRKMKHKHLMPLLDRWIDQKREVAVIITPLATPLREFTESWRNHIRIGPVRIWLTQLLDALSYLHTHEPRVIHRDLKLDNVLLSPEGHVWLGDYGLARYAKGGTSGDSREKQTQYTGKIGTPAFMAPELFEEEHYSYKVDIYAFGMTMVELLSGRPPFRDCGHRLLTLINKLQAGEVPDEIYMIRSELARNMIKWCIEKDSKMRPDTQELMLHPFLMPCMFDPINSKLPLRLNRLEMTHSKLRNELSDLCDKVIKAAKNSEQEFEARRVIDDARKSLHDSMQQSIESAEIAAKKDVVDRGFVKYSMILHDHVNKTLSMLKDNDEDDIDEEENEDDDKNRAEKKTSSKDIIEESRQALLRTRALSHQNLDPESVTSATSISDVVDGWLVNVYKSEYMKVSDVVKDSVVKHLNRRRQQLNAEIVPQALAKAADMMEERFQKDCRKPLEDLKLAFDQTEIDNDEQQRNSNNNSSDSTSTQRDRTDTVIEFDLNSTMVENDGSSNSVILNENDFKDEEMNERTIEKKEVTKKKKMTVRFDDVDSGTKRSTPVSSTIPARRSVTNGMKDELVVTSNGIVIHNADQKSEIPSNFDGHRQSETWHQGQRDTRRGVTKTTYNESDASDTRPRVKRLRRSMSVPSQSIDRDSARGILMRTPPKQKRELGTILEPSPASKMAREQLSEVKGVDDVARTLSMGTSSSSASSSSSSSSRMRTKTVSMSKPIEFKFPQSAKEDVISNGAARSRESSDADDVHRCESEVTSLMDKNLKDFSLTSIGGSNMKTESRSRNTSNVSESSFSQNLLSSSSTTKDLS